MHYRHLLLIATSLASVTTNSFAQLPNPEPIATAWAMGTFVFRGQHKGQRYVLNANVIAPHQPQNPGASAAFGVDDSGRVMLIGNTEYQPTQALSTVRRLFETPKPPMTKEQAPRFLMVCSWAINDQRQISGPLTVGYAERDDSSVLISRDGTLQESFNLHWIHIPSARAKEKFAKINYCGEFARTKKVAAPLWLMPGKER